MTSVEARPSRDSAGHTSEPFSSRARRGAPLIVGAALILLLLEPIGSLPLKGYIPIIIGLSYVAAGLLSGKRGLLLGPGVVIAVWGIAPMTTNYADEFSGMFYLTLGTGLLIAALLAERGWSRITPMSLALPVLFIGGTMFIAPRVGDYLTTVLAALLVGWALWEMRPQPARDREAAGSPA